MTPLIDDPSMEVGAAYLRPASAAQAPLTENEKRIASVHEAGHLIFAKALSEIPPQLTASIGPRKGEPGLGRVAFGEQRFALESIHEWLMLMALGGEQAEKLILGECADGNTEDINDWLRGASHYLNGDEEWLFSRKGSDQRRSKLAELIADHRIRVQGFLSQNRETLEAIAQALCDNDTLHADDIEHLLEGVVLPDWMPCPQLAGHLDS